MPNLRLHRAESCWIRYNSKSSRKGKYYTSINAGGLLVVCWCNIVRLYGQRKGKLLLQHGNISYFLISILMLPNNNETNVCLILNPYWELLFFFFFFCVDLRTSRVLRVKRPQSQKTWVTSAAFPPFIFLSFSSLTIRDQVVKSTTNSTAIGGGLQRRRTLMRPPQLS